MSDWDLIVAAMSSREILTGLGIVGMMAGGFIIALGINMTMGD